MPMHCWMTHCVHAYVRALARARSLPAWVWVSLLLVVSGVLGAGLETPVAAAATPTHLASSSSASSATSIDVSLPAPVGAGTVVFVSVGSAGGAASSVATISDSNGNLWQRVASSYAAPAGGELWASFVTSPISAGATLSVTFDGPAQSAAVSVDGVTGALSPMLGGADGTNDGAGSDTTPATAVTTTHASDLLFALVATNGPPSDTFTPGFSTTALAVVGDAGAAPNATAFTSYRSVSSTSSYSLGGTLSTPRDWRIAAAGVELADGVTAAPSPATAPSIAAPPAMGDVDTTTAATWNNAVDTVTRFWSRCDASGNQCQPIPGAGAASYTPVVADRGHTLRLTEIATNDGGSASSTSAASAVVVAQGYVAGMVGSAIARPNSTTATITLTAPVPAGDTLIFATSFSMTAAGGSSLGWSDMNGALADDGDTAWFWADKPTLIGGVIAQFVVRPLQAGDTFTWTTDQPMNLFEGQLFDIAGVTEPADPFAWTGGNGSGTVVNSNENLPSTRSLVFTATTSEMIGSTQTFTPVGSFTSLPALSSSGGAPNMSLYPAVERSFTAGPYSIGGTFGTTDDWMVFPIPMRMIDATTPPTNTVTPSITGTVQQGQVLSVSTGTWTGSPSYDYVWERCDASGTVCTNLFNDTSTYTVQASDVGSFLTAIVVGTNAGGSVVAFAEPTTQVATLTAPANTTRPVVSGGVQVGDTLTTSNGTWTGSPVSYAYAWLRCDSAGASCSVIAGATGSSYVLTVADVGARIRSRVTATNGGGSTPATSLATAEVEVAVSSVTVTSTAPGSIAQGRQALPIVINGTGFQAGATVSVSGVGVTVGSVTVASTTEIDATVTAAGGAPPGARDVTVTNTDLSTGTETAGLAVTAASISVSLTTLGYDDTATTTGAPWSLSFGSVLPAATKQIGPVGSGQRTAGAAIEAAVTSDTDYDVTATASDFSDGVDSIPISTLTWKHHSVTEPWTPFAVGANALDAGQGPGTATHAYDVSVTPRATDPPGTYSTVLVLTVLPVP
jgi:hypothetical protein